MVKKVRLLKILYEITYEAYLNENLAPTLIITKN